MFQYLGEMIALAVAFSWTITALAASEASVRIGSNPANIFRMILSIIFIALTLWVATGSPVPQFTDWRTWMWLLLSGAVGYVFGDYCLFNAYIHIGARFGQLFMTLAPPVSALLGWLFLHESLGWKSILAMVVTLSGIAMCVLARNEEGQIRSSLPLKGILLGIGAGIGQGAGLVLSKIGMDCYTASLPADVPASVVNLMPFTSTMIRAFAGLAGFLVIMAVNREAHMLKAAVRNGKGMMFTGLTTVFGPFLGVSLSLMAVQYTKAGIAATIMALTPVLIILPHCLIYKKKISFREVAGTVISLVGTALFFL